MPDLPDEVRTALAELPHSPDGWWHTSDGEQYDKTAAEMLALGIDPETVIRWCTALYAAAANEFGG